MNQTDKVLNLISNTTDKFEEFELTYRYLYREKSHQHYRKFMVLCLLDHMLTVIDPKDLEDYKEYRGKGWV